MTGPGVRAYPGNPATLPPGFQPMTFGNAIRAACARNPEKPAVLYNDQVSTYGELVRRSDALRDAAIADLGLRKGDTAAIVARNCIEYLEVVAGLPDAGVGVATINPRLTPAEIARPAGDLRRAEHRAGAGGRS